MASITGISKISFPTAEYRAVHALQINNVYINSDLSNFLAYLDLSIMPASFWNSLQRTDGGDIRMFMSDGTRIPMYIHKIDTVSKTGYMFTRIPNVYATSSNILHLKSGNSSLTIPAVTDPYGRNATFQDHRVFYDFENDPSSASPQLVDLTGNGNDGTSAGTMTSSDLVSGKIGNAWDFDGVNDYADAGTPSYMSDTQGAISLWVKINAVLSADGAQAIFGIGDTNVGSYPPYLWITLRRHPSYGTTNTYFDISSRISGNSSSEDSAAATDFPIVVGNTYYVVVSADGVNSYIYVNGIASTLTSYIGTGNVNWIGALSMSGARASISDIFFSNSWLSKNSKITPSLTGVKGTLPSADRVSAEYNNQNDPASFYTITDITPQKSIFFGAPSTPRSMPSNGIQSAWSVRTIVPGYTGPLLRVRNESDNSETDVYADADGIASWAANTSAGMTLGQWTGTDNLLRVVKFYDQTGYQDMFQPTTTRQPYYGGSGGYLGLPHLRMPTSSSYGGYWLKTSSYIRPNPETTIITHNILWSYTVGEWIISQREAGTGTPKQFQMLSGYYTSSAPQAFTFSTWGQTSPDSAIQTYTSFVVNTKQWYDFTGRIRQTEAAIFVDGVNSASSTLPEPVLYNTDQPVYLYQVGWNESSSSWWKGWTTEAVIYSRDLTDSEIAQIKTDRDAGVISDPVTSKLASAISLRRVVSGYTSPILRVRRSSDSAETDVYFDNNGVVSTNSTVSAGGTLGTWMGADNLYIRKWWDQAAPTEFREQPTASRQPQLFLSGGQDNKPYVKFDGVDDGLYMLSNNHWGTHTNGTFFGYVNTYDATKGAIMTGTYSSSGMVLCTFYADVRHTGSGSTTWDIAAVRILMRDKVGGSWVGNDIRDNLTGTFAHPTTPYLYAAYSDGSAYTLHMIGRKDYKHIQVGADNGAWFDSRPGTDVLSIGMLEYAGGSWYYPMDFYEVLYYNPYLNDQEFVYVERDIRKYYKAVL